MCENAWCDLFLSLSLSLERERSEGTVEKHSRLKGEKLCCGVECTSRVVGSFSGGKRV